MSSSPSEVSSEYSSSSHIATSSESMSSSSQRVVGPSTRRGSMQSGIVVMGGRLAWRPEPRYSFIVSMGGKLLLRVESTNSSWLTGVFGGVSRPRDSGEYMSGGFEGRLQ